MNFCSTLPEAARPDMLAGIEGIGIEMVPMGKLTIAGFAVVLLTAGCSSAASGVCQCPKPVAYDDATIKKITQALRELPADNVLHRAMDDYEDERDDLRACLAAAR